ncbi:hypothetical protein ABDK96_15740 [Citricoccus nitrophenolicus]|uniref:Uncharacterized protein n=1 Tax=Citricoccus nitrophenolicus TaxID=863575 RepID=A0ABV0ILT1_9MICC
MHTGLTEQLSNGERPRTDRPEDLARAATRAEISRPGFMDQLLARTDRTGSGRGGGLAAGVAGGLGAGLLVGVAGAFTGAAEGMLPTGESAVDQAGGLFDRFLGGGFFGNVER